MNLVWVTSCYLAVKAVRARARARARASVRAREGSPHLTVSLT